MYTYENGRLVISLETAEPAAMHESLLKGLALAFRNSVKSTSQKEDHLHALYDLFDALLPDERALEKGHS